MQEIIIRWWIIKLLKTISFCAISSEINHLNVHCFTTVRGNIFNLLISQLYFGIPYIAYQCISVWPAMKFLSPYTYIASISALYLSGNTWSAPQIAAILTFFLWFDCCQYLHINSTVTSLILGRSSCDFPSANEATVDMSMNNKPESTESYSLPKQTVLMKPICIYCYMCCIRRWLGVRIW